jgi:hypothetical protein
LCRRVAVPFAFALRTGAAVSEESQPIVESRGRMACVVPAWAAGRKAREGTELVGTGQFQNGTGARRRSGELVGVRRRQHSSRPQGVDGGPGGGRYSAVPCFLAAAFRSPPAGAQSKTSPRVVRD